MLFMYAKRFFYKFGVDASKPIRLNAKFEGFSVFGSFISLLTI